MIIRRCVTTGLFCVPLVFSGGCSENSAEPPRLTVHWQLDNQPDGRIAAVLILRCEEGAALPAEGWDLYFNCVRELKEASEAAPVSVEHVNGDFFRLSPKVGFPGLAPGENLQVELSGLGSAVNPADGPSGTYLVMTGFEPIPVEREEMSLPHTDEQLRRSSWDRVPLMTPQERYRRQESLHLLPPDQLSLVVPTPRSVTGGLDSQVILRSDTSIHYSAELELEAGYLSDFLTKSLGEAPALVPDDHPSPAPDRILLVLEGDPSETESYHLKVDPREGVIIRASAPPGVFYGIQTLQSLIAPEFLSPSVGEILVPTVTVEDGPRFEYRGVHLDVARNFHSVEELYKLLELMALYKLNRLHLHLCDDEGWRLEIPGLPELTQVGARRGHTLDESDRLMPSWGSGPYPDEPPGSGYYAREEFISILQFAKRRHIQVIPEIETPGHARAAIKSMEARERRLLSQEGEEAATAYRLRHPEDASQYRSVQGWNDNVIDVCLDSSYAFLAKVFDEIQAMYRDAEAPLEVIHVGGDEVPEGVWENSPACATLAAGGGPGDKTDRKNYFLRRVSDLLQERQLTLAGWEEVALVGETHGPSQEKVPNPEFADRGFRAYVWNSVWGWGGEENAYLLANAGYPVVLCNASNLYLDMAYEKHPEEVGLYWAGFTNTRDPWDFRPLNLYLGAVRDVMGRPVDPGTYARATRLTQEGRRRVLGIQGELWSEFLRSPERLEYMAFPKLLALAERAWAAQPAWASAVGPAAAARQEEDWNRFANTLGQRALPRLDVFAGGVAYRLPPPGAEVREGRLLANCEFPGLTIRYTLDGSEPTVDSAVYTAPVEVSGASRTRTVTEGPRAGETTQLARSRTIKLRTFDTRGRGSRTVTVTAE